MIASNHEHYYVMNENALGVIMPGQEFPMMELLATSIIRGGPNCMNGVAVVSGNVRRATLEDFDTFRLMPPTDWGMSNG